MKKLSSSTYPLLETKMYIPPFKENSVCRTSLIKKINTGIEKKLTLISAPAGYGKTTLLSEWTQQCEMLISWISLCENDNNLVCFIESLITALRCVDKNIGAGSMMMLQSSKSLPIEFVASNLINEIAHFTESFTLVLDDYHSILDKEVHKFIEFLIENSPKKMHIVIATRVDPLRLTPIFRPLA